MDSVRFKKEIQAYIYATKSNVTVLFWYGVKFGVPTQANDMCISTPMFIQSTRSICSFSIFVWSSYVDRAYGTAKQEVNDLRHI